MDGSGETHTPVLLDRIVELLAVPAGEGMLVDATIGAAGHAAALLAASAPDVRLVGFDRDPAALEIARRRLAAYRGRVELVAAGYDELGDRLAALDVAGAPVLGVLYDLGVSSMQLDTPARGFSFRVDAPLDMRMDPSSSPSAAELLDELDEAELVRVLRVYGEERYARRIASAILRARPLHSTRALADTVVSALPAHARHGRPHPATRTFQALRIVVNAELDRFGASLPQALETVAPAAMGATGPAPRGGRIAVLSYHSLEDRMAKRTFADAAGGCVCPPDLPVCACGRTPLVRLLTRGAERPGDDEIARNPRARSARLRAVEKLPTPQAGPAAAEA